MTALLPVPMPPMVKLKPPKVTLPLLRGVPWLFSKTVAAGMPAATAVLMMVNTAPWAGVYPTDPVRIMVPVTVPVPSTLIWSYCVPAVGPFDRHRIGRPAGECDAVGPSGGNAASAAQYGAVAYRHGPVPEG